MNQLKTGPWNLSELKDVKPNGKTVFSCFHCGGGSTMGYKLAGYNVLGGVEIDPEMMKIYRANHNPLHSYLMGVQQFKNLSNDQLPKELFDLDILDGSPPCSSFSMAGSREKAWGEKKKFREGQAHQVLDDLFFDFIDIAKKLKPKIVVAENVKGLIQGNAKGYVKEIFKQFNEAGYDVQLFLLNAAFMGVPQRRERTFFIARKKELNLKSIELVFSEKPISISESIKNVDNSKQKIIFATEESKKLWYAIKPGENFAKAHKNKSRFNEIKLNPFLPANTLPVNSTPWHWNTPRRLTGNECIRLQSFPDDFNFLNSQIHYVCGMSVPPFMMQRVADQIYKQWLINL